MGFSFLWGVSRLFWRAMADVPIGKDQTVIVDGQEENNNLVLKVKPLSSSKE